MRSPLLWLDATYHIEFYACLDRDQPFVNPFVNLHYDIIYFKTKEERYSL